MVPGVPKLDRIDLRILAHLQRNGRATNVDLAEAVGLSPSPCLTRVKRLEKAGEPDRIGKFYATITYEFQPTTASAVQLVWENPFGFTVTDYRVTAESLEAQNMEGQK